MSKEMLDCVGVPEFFATTTRLENAGGGNVRIFNCIERSGILIPACTVIFPRAYILSIEAGTRKFAQMIASMDMESETAH